MKDNIAPSRKDALELISKSSVYGNLGLFIGTGMSMAILNNEVDEIALSWKELIHECCKDFKVNFETEIQTEGLSYPEIATQIALAISKRESITYQNALKKLKERISALTSWYPEKEKRAEYSKILLSIAPNWIITTNYDLIIECLLTGKCLSLGPNDQLIAPQNLIPVYHLHGIRTNPDSIIISQEDYISLFRPNQYRQQKLSLSFKESTTLIIGYGLGDVNVLTAVDWTKNVYSNQRINYPHDIIQLLYTKKPISTPYRDKNDILIIEFDDLTSILQEITNLTLHEKEKQEKQDKKLSELNSILANPSEEEVEKFIDNPDFRKQIIDAIRENDIKLISGFLELFSKAIDETWYRARPRKAFYAYDQNLTLLLDVIENIKLQKMPPALFELISYNLGRVSHYVGNRFGESNAAYKTWINRKNSIPKETIIELKNIARSRGSHSLISLLGK